MTFSLCYSDDNKKNIFDNGGDNEHGLKQESIPVGCIPFAFLITDGVSLQRPPKRNIRQEQRLPEGTWDQRPDRK